MVRAPLSQLPASLTAEHTVLGPLGSGGRGMVWRTRRLSDRTEWAVKVLHRTDPAGIARMKAEYRTLARADHPAVVTPERLWASSDSAWFCMQHIEQGTPLPRWANRARLRDRWTEDGLARVRPLLRQLVEGIVAIHRTGVVHRDIKPDNILVDAHEQIFLLDLDLAAPPTDTAIAGRILGTPGYRAPELSLGLPVGTAADWYGLGAVLYELFTGRAPFGRRPRSSLRAQRRRGAPDLAVARPDVPPMLARVVNQLLQSDAQARPQLHELLTQFGARPVRAAESTLAALRRAHMVPGSWVDVHGATPQVRRAALSEVEPASAWRLSVRFGGVSDAHLGPIDALASGLARLLHQMPREQRAQVLPRERTALLRVAPDLALLPELAARAPVQSAPPSPRPMTALTELTARLSTQGPLTLHLEDIHRAKPADIAHLESILAQAAPQIRVIAEGQLTADALQMAALRAIRRRFSATATVRCRPVDQSPVKPSHR